MALERYGHTYTFQGAFQKRAYRKIDVLNITPYQIILRKSRLHLLSFHLPKIIFSKRLAGRRPYYSTKILMQLLVKDKQDPSLGQGADIRCFYRHFPAECYSATGMYLEAIQLLMEAFYDNNMSPEKRMYQAWFAKTFIVIWMRTCHLPDCLYLNKLFRMLSAVRWTVAIFSNSDEFLVPQFFTSDCCPCCEQAFAFVSYNFCPMET